MNRLLPGSKLVTKMLGRRGRRIKACPVNCLKPMPLSAGPVRFLTPVIIPRLWDSYMAAMIFRTEAISCPNFSGRSD